jgi:hypothetical protein
METERSPQIEDVVWGCVRVRGQERPYKDAKLFPGGARQWDWRETGTSHSPGILPADVEDLLELGAEVVVLSNGMLGRLKTAAETLALLRERGIEVHVLRTPEAVRLYNRLSRDRKVGALIHSTC